MPAGYVKLNTDHVTSDVVTLDIIPTGTLKGNPDCVLTDVIAIYQVLIICYIYTTDVILKYLVIDNHVI